MATKQGPGARGNHRTTSHFTLGNDEWKVMPTYTSDYSFVHTFPTIRTKKSVEQPCAEVIPPATNALEEGKWYSSTMRDFAEFGQLSRRNAYETSKSSCKRNKDLQTSELGLLQEDSRFPVTTMYRAQMPKCTTARQVLFKTNQKPSSAKTNNFVTEAQYAFQWPISDRVKLPMHVRNPSSST